MLDTWTLAILAEMDGSLDHAVHIVEIGSGKRQPVIHLDGKPRAPKRWSAEFLIADLARSAIARDGPCAACRTPGSGLSGVDGDARQGHPLADAAARGQHDLGPGSAWVIRNAPRGPGQDALIVRPSGVEVPMGSLLSVIAVTVASNAPAVLEVAAVKVRTERPPIAAADGENDAVTPPGRPPTLSATGVPYRSAAARNEMVILVR
jgi:hypothetical protein